MFNANANGWEWRRVVFAVSHRSHGYQTEMLRLRKAYRHWTEKITKLFGATKPKQHTPLVIYCTFPRNSVSFCIDFLRSISLVSTNFFFFYIPKFQVAEKRKNTVCIANGTIFLSLLEKESEEKTAVFTCISNEKQDFWLLLLWMF